MNGQILADIKDIANTLGKSFADISNEESYLQSFKIYKRNAERKILTFRISTRKMCNNPVSFEEL